MELNGEVFSVFRMKQIFNHRLTFFNLKICRGNFFLIKFHRQKCCTAKKPNQTTKNPKTKQKTPHQMKTPQVPKTQAPQTRPGDKKVWYQVSGNWINIVNLWDTHRHPMSWKVLRHILSFLNTCRKKCILSYFRSVLQQHQ